MTWQRIDENTYIDDTLVTCAEYQLFIDEMREQGKYYQPDHWTSHKFPAGHARKPVLGVRHYDAIAFCEWLTERQKSEWKFHLPNTYQSYPSKITIEQTSACYWLSYKHLFSWLIQEPINARNLQYDQAYVSDFNLGFDLANALFQGFDRTIEIDKAISSSYNRPLDITRFITNEQIAIRLNNGTKFPLTSALNRDPESFQLISYGIENECGRIIANALDYYRNISMALVLYMDIITLRERIAGRSPAFEGIRLVKERIQ